MSAHTPATPAMISAITTIRGAFAQAMQAAGDALKAGGDQLPAAQAQWQSAHAALRVVDHKGLVRVSDELGKLIATPGDAFAHAQVFAHGAAALTGYMDELVAGRDDQPLRMMSAYRTIAQARGVEQVAESDLYFPDTTKGPGDRADAPAVDVDRLRLLRRQLEGGLLSWLRKADDPSGLRQVFDALQAVEATQGSSRQRALWWVAQAVADAVLHGGLTADNHVRRLITQINLQLGRLVQGNADYPDNLLREALYHVARATPATPLVQTVQQTYALAGSLDIAEKSVAGASAEAVAAARKHLDGLQDAWAACAAGSGDTNAFAARIDGLSAACQSLGNNALTALAAQIAQTARKFSTSQKISDATAVEGACALLMLEHALSGEAKADGGFEARAQNMAARLKLSVDAPDTLQMLPPAELFDEDGKRTQARGLIAQVHGEVAAGLRRIEEALDGWFRAPEQRDVLTALDKPFAQVAGALTVLGNDDASALLGKCRADVARYAAGENCDAAARESLARRITALSGFAQAAQRGTANLPDMLRQAGLEPSEFVSPAIPAVQPDPVFVPDKVPVETPAPQVVATPEVVAVVEPLPIVAAETAEAVADAAVAVDDATETDPEMLEVFLEEAGEVVTTISTTLPQSRAEPTNQELLTTIRRAFHTLKGSGRMVGLKNLGEAAWEMEQVMNERQPKNEPGTPDLYRLIETAQGCFSRWVEELKTSKQARIDAAQIVDWAKKIRAGESLQEAEAPAPAVATQTPAAVDVAPIAPAPAEEVLEIGDTRISRELYDIFVSEAQQNGDALIACNSRLQAGANVEGEFVRAVHTLSGISGTAGFSAVRALSQSLERVLQRASDDNNVPAADARACINRAVTALSGQLNAVAARSAPAAYPDIVSELDALMSSSAVSPALSPAPTPTETVPATEPPVDVLTQTGEMSKTDRRRIRLNDDVDPQLLPIFLAEAQELVPQVGQDLRDWRARRDDKLVPQSLKRLLHTLKGSARMAGAMALGELTHGMESRVENATLLPTIPDSLFDELESSFDRIGVLVERLQGDERPDERAAQPAPELPEVMDQMAKSMRIATGSMAAATTASLPGTPAAAQAVPVVTTQRPLLRVRADLVDRLANQAGEVSIARARIAAEMRSVRASLRDLTENIGRLRGQLRELEIQAETQMQSRFGAAQEQPTDGKFDPLEFDRFTRLQELTRLMAESVNDVATVQQSLIRDLDEGEKALSAQARMTRDVQQELMAIRMVQFSSLNDRLYRVTRLAAKDSSKRVNLEIKGGHVELDRSVLDRIAAPFEHLLRNAIAHGIEDPAQRKEIGKAESGEIVIEIRQEGNEAVLMLGDDGAGLNVERIRQKAVGLGLMRADEQLTDEQIGEFIFRSGFSTAAQVTEVAGRGVGMDVVMNEISSLGGRIETSSVRGKGTKFTIYLPLTLAVLQAVVLRLGGNHYAVPTLMVEQVQKVKQDALASMRASRVIQWQGTPYPFHHLRQLLGLPPATGENERFSPILLLRSGPHRTAIQVDDLIGGQEIVIKNIGPQLARVPGITGAAVLGTGETVLILNPVLLAQRSEELTKAESAPAGSQAEEPMVTGERVPTLEPIKVVPPSIPPPMVPHEDAHQRSVMVVDDSLTVRKITGRLLSREGYEVITAKDGIEALEKLQDKMPDVMLTDVEMPRMDGFDLTRNVRADVRMKGLPIIMITSRTADKHREHATELGVDVFLGKPYEESALLRHIADLIKAQTAH